MKVYSLSRKTTILWQVRVAVIAAAIGIFVRLFLWGYMEFQASLWLYSLILTIVEIYYIPMYFKSYKISFPDGAILIERGILIRTTYVMPFSRLVYAQSYASPIAKLLKLSGLSFKAARSKIFIPEIAEDDVKYIIQSLAVEAENEKGI